MHGPIVLTKSISARQKPDKWGNPWQYHPRSDDHSKAACWAILFDLLLHCDALRRHAEQGLIGFGINRTMHDYKLNRQKDLDLVICRHPSSGTSESRRSFADLAKHYRIVLNDEQRQQLTSLPDLWESPTGTVLMALEAKACMTEHGKARPRLYDELTSSHMTVHGDTANAISVGFVIVNTSDEFISPLRNKADLKVTPTCVTRHKQPSDARRVVQKVKELPRRAHEGETGYDSVGIVLLDAINDGTEVRLLDPPPPTYTVDHIFLYETMIDRIGHWYDMRFGMITRGTGGER